MTVRPPRSFGPALLAAAEAAGTALLAIKACAHGKYEAGAERKYEACWYLPEEDPAFVETPPRGSDPRNCYWGPQKLFSEIAQFLGSPFCIEISCRGYLLGPKHSAVSGAAITRRARRRGRTARLQ